MKKIAFFMHNLCGGGAEKVLVDIINNLDVKNNKITLILIEKKGVYLNQIPRDIDVIFIEEKLKFIPNKIYLKLIKYFPKIFYYIAIKESYDVEVAFMEGFLTKLVANSRNNNSEKICWVHADFATFHWTKNIFKKGKEAECYNKFDDIVFVSNQAKFSFENLFPLNNSNKQVIYNPIISSKIISKSREQNIKFEQFTVISVGRLMPEKGYERLINAHAELVDKYPHKLIILGEGKERKKLEKLIKILNVEKSVELKGFIENPYSYIKAADLFICSSITEGYSLVVCESIILGKLVISTDTAGPKEILGNGEYGIICKNSTDGIKNSLEYVLKDKNIIQNYEEKTIERKKDFDYIKVIKDIEKIIIKNN